MLSFLHQRWIFPALLLLVLPLTLILSPPSTVIASQEGAVKVAVLPFHTPSPGDNGEAVATLISSVLSRNNFITVIPNEVIVTTLHDLSPALLWGEERGGERSGGLIWRVNDTLIVDVVAATSADYTIYGSLTRFGELWRIEATLSSLSRGNSRRSFTATALADGEIPEKVEGIADEIVSAIEEDTVLIRAEELIRLYMAGIATYPATAERLDGLAAQSPDNFPLHLLILDYYMKDESDRRGEVLRLGERSVALYKSANEEELRYLRLYDLDPFDVTATEYEDRNQWESAISVRLEALRLLSTNLAAHRAALGLDYYHLARLHDEAVRSGEALDSYRNALEYLPQHSKEFPIATERVERLSSLGAE